MTIKYMRGFFAATVLLLALPAFAFADGSATIAALLPGDTVGVGTTVSFTVVPSGFTNPTYTVIDSFGGGVNNRNINAYGDLSWTPNNSDLGSHTITITVTDSAGDTATASQTINVVAPQVTISNLAPGSTVQYGNPVSFTLGSTGFVSPQYTVADSYGYSTVSFADTDGSGNFHWTPIYQDIGTHTLVATARDYQGHLATATQTITVTGPVTVGLGAVSPGSSVHVGEAVSFAATTTGFVSPAYAVSDNFTSSLGTSTLGVDANGKVTWTPNSNDVGAHTIVLTATDSAGHTGSAQTTIQVLFGSAAPSTPAAVMATTTQSAPAAQTAEGAPYVFKTFLTVGSTGPDVTALQNLLTTLGFFSVTPTGYFGQVTKGALQKYQAAHGIDSVGYAGPMTRASLSTGK